MLKMIIVFEMLVDMTNVEKIINLVDQGWVHGETVEYHYETIALRKKVVMNFDGKVHVMKYVEAFNSITGIDQKVVDFYEY